MHAFESERAPLRNKNPLFVEIPSSAKRAAQMAGLRNDAINKNHEKFREPCVDIRTLSIAGENYYHKDGENPPYNQRIPGSIPELYLRESVAEKLLKVNQRLRHLDFEVHVFDGWRPPEIQKYFYYTWMPRFINDHLIRKGLKPLIGDALDREVNRFWAKPRADGSVDPLSPPAHTTGGAVDLTLRERRGRLLDMGSGFDDFTDRARTDFYEGNTWRRRVLQNRRLLFNAMREQGFESNPNEWWHHSIGDQMAERLRGSERAFYSFIDPRTASLM